MKTLKESQKIVGITILINMMMYIFWRMIYSVNLSTSADKIMDMFFVDGAEGSEITAMWMKTVPNQVMQIAYSLLPTLSWYVLFQQGCVLVALSVITYIVIKRGINWANCVLGIVFLLSVGYEGYIQLNYIKTAFICCAAVCLLVHSTVKAKLLWGTLLWLMGYFWCGEAAILTAVVLLGVVLAKKIKWNKKSVLIVVGVALCVLVLEGVNLLGAKKQTEKNEVTLYYEVWTTIEKNGWPNYMENQGVFEALNISAEDYLLILDINTLNEEIISLEQLQEILKITEVKTVDSEYILRFLRTYPVKLVHLRVFYSLLIISFFFAISETSKKKEKMIGIYAGTYLMLGVTHLCDMGDNTGVARGVLILGMTLLIGLFEKLEVKSKEWKQYYVLMMLMFLMIALANAS